MIMKLKLSVFTLFAMASYSFGQAQSDIVGYVSLGNTSSGVAVPAGTDVTFSIPFANKTAFSGTVASATATTVTLSAGALPASTDFSTGDAHIITVTSGAQEGASALILSNAGNVLTIQPTNAADFTTIATSDQVEISPAWTLSNVFDGNLPAGTQVFAFDASTNSINESTTQGYVTNGSNGWFQIIGGNGVADDTILHVGESFVIRAVNTDITSLTVSGVVPEYNSRVSVTKTAPSGTGQDVRIGYVSPEQETVLESGLGFSPGDQLLVFDQDTTGENKSASQGLVWSGTNWFGIIGLNGPQDDFVLEPGVGYVYRFAPASPSQENDWNDVQSYR